MRLADGRALTRHVSVSSGAGDRAMTQEVVVEKFMASASMAVSPARAECIRDAVLALEAISVAELMAELRGG